jgi:hypothetical protein
MPYAATDPNNPAMPTVSVSADSAAWAETAPEGALFTATDILGGKLLQSQSGLAIPVAAEGHHAPQHAIGSVDIVTPSAIGAVAASAVGAASGVMGLDASSRGTSAPQLHATAHATGGDDPVQITTAQVTGLATLIAGNTVTTTEIDTPLGAAAVFTGNPHVTAGYQQFSVSASADQAFTVVILGSSDGATNSTLVTKVAALSGSTYLVSTGVTVSTAYVTVQVTCGSTAMTVLTVTSELVTPSSTIPAGSITDLEVSATAAIEQSKIYGLTSSLNAKASSVAVASIATTSGALVVNQHNPVNASSGPLTMTLPTGQTAGTWLSVEKTDTSANIVTISGNIRDAASSSINLKLVDATNGSHETVWLVADSSGSWWPLASHKTLSSLITEFLTANGVTISGAPTASGQVLTSTSTSAAGWAAPAGAGGATIDTTSGDIQALGTQAAGSKGEAADAEHVHPTTGLVTTTSTFTGGDLAGTGLAATVAKIQGTSISSPPGGTTQFLAGNGTWQTPPGSSSYAATAASFGYLGWTNDPVFANAATAGISTRLYWTRFRALTTSTCGHIGYFISGAGSGLTSGENFLAIYDTGQTTAGYTTLLGQTADQTTNFASSSTYISAAITSPPTLTAGQDYFIAFLAVGTTIPTFYRAPGTIQALMNAGLSGLSSRIARDTTSGLTSLPSSVIASSVSMETDCWAWTFLALS